MRVWSDGWSQEGTTDLLNLLTREPRSLHCSAHGSGSKLGGLERPGNCSERLEREKGGSAAVTYARAPLNFPMGVRAKDTITTSFAAFDIYGSAFDVPSGYRPPFFFLNFS